MDEGVRAPFGPGNPA